MTQVYVDKAPDSLLRADGKGSEMRAKWEKMIRKAQDEICGAIEKADGAQPFESTSFAVLGKASTCALHPLESPARSRCKQSRHYKSSAPCRKLAHR